MQKKITVKIHRYEHPTYNQLIDPFIPFASTIDLIMMYGHRSKEVMQGARRYIYPITI